MPCRFKSWLDLDVFYFPANFLLFAEFITIINHVCCFLFVLLNLFTGGVGGLQNMMRQFKQGAADNFGVFMGEMIGHYCHVTCENIHSVIYVVRNH